MKTKLCAIAVLMPALFLSACGEQSAPAAAPPVASTDAAAPAAMPEATTSMSATDVRVADDAASVTTCNLETVNGTMFEGDTPSVSRAEPVSIVGWLIDEPARIVPTEVKLRLQSADGAQAWEQAVTQWGDRSDIATAKGNEFLASGFNADLSVAAIPAGEYAIYLAFATPEGERVCGFGRRLVLTE
ncbi:hypothetical protein [Lysobacter hankyongensis]|uniref:DUF4625 domain-containing protein n=1 Tax=Lysobacter hankyongensis TaxID=1176535 RepID=A0ABP9AZR6_9GAMM